MFSELKKGLQELRAMRLGKRAARAIEAGNMFSGLELFRKALEIMETTFGEIEQTIIYAWDLAIQNEQYGKFAEAEAYYRRVLSFLESHPDSGALFDPSTTIDHLLRVLHMQGKAAEAERLKATLDYMDEDEYERFANHYYETGSRDKAVTALKNLVRKPEEFNKITEDGRNSSLPFFFSRIAYDDPSLFREYEKLFKTPHHDLRVLILHILELGNDPAIKGFLESHVDDEDYADEKDLIQDILNSGGNKALDPLSIPPVSGYDLDRLWAEFIVSGNPDAVSSIIQVLDQPDLIRNKLESWLHTLIKTDPVADHSKKSHILEKLNEELQVITTFTNEPWSTEGIVCDLESGTIVTEEDLDCLCSLAQVELRDKDNFQAVLDALPFEIKPTEIEAIITKASAKWSLASNAKQHEKVFATCKSAASGKEGRAKLSLLHIAVEREAWVKRWASALPLIREYVEIDPSNLEMKSYLELALRDERFDKLDSGVFSEDIDKFKKERLEVDSDDLLRRMANAISALQNYRSVVKVRDFRFEERKDAGFEIVKWKIDFARPHSWRILQDCIIENWPDGGIDEWRTIGNIEYPTLGSWTIVAETRTRERVESILPMEVPAAVFAEDRRIVELYSSGIEGAVIIETPLTIDDTYASWKIASFRKELVEALHHMFANVYEGQMQFNYVPVLYEKNPQVSILHNANGLIIADGFSGRLLVHVDAILHVIRKAELHLNGSTNEGDDVQLVIEYLFGDYDSDIEIPVPQTLKQ